MIWCIWRERNSQNFEDCDRKEVELKDIKFKMLYGWMVGITGACFSNFLEFLDLFSFSP